MDASKKKRPAQSNYGAYKQKRKKLDLKDAVVIPDPDVVKKIQDDNEIPSEGLKLALHGNIFQLKLLMLLLWRAKTRGYPSFRIATELSECDKFDDVIFQYERNKEWRLRLIQAKHKEGLHGTTAKITTKDLLSTDMGNEYGLQKYFNSFRKIKQRSKADSVYSILPSSTLEDMIICTNIPVASEVEASLTKIDLQTDELFSIETNCLQIKPSVYKINAVEDTKIVNELRYLLQETGDLFLLVDVLSDSIASHKPIERTGITKEYEYALSNKIFDVEAEGKFQKTFLNMPSKRNDRTRVCETEQMFRKVLLKEIILKMKLIDKKSLPDVKINYFNKLNVSKDFGNSELTTNETALKDIALKLANDVVDKKIRTKNYPCLAILLKHVIDVDNRKFYPKFLRKCELKDLLKLAIKELGRRMTDNDLKDIEFEFDTDSLDLGWPKDCTNLFKKICDNAIKNKQFNVESFDLYHLLIAEHVIDVDNKTWKQGFLMPDPDDRHMLPPQVKQLRRLIIDRMIPDNQLNAKSLQNLTINFSKGYVNSFRPQEEFVVTNVEELAKTFCEIISKSPSTRVLIKDTSISADELDIIQSDLQNLAGHVLIKKYGKIRFRTRFLYSPLLPDSLTDFRIELKKVLGNKFETLCECEFDIQNIQFTTCDEDLLETELPAISTLEDVEEFFDKLKIMVDFPNRKQITHVMMEEMQDHFKELSSKDFNALYQDILRDWMAKRMGTFYTAATMEKLFLNLQNDILSRKMEGVTKSYISNIMDTYRFLDYTDFVDFLKHTEVQVLHVFTNSLKLSRLRIGQTFRNLTKGVVAEDLRPYIWKGGQLFVTSGQLKDNNFCANVQASYERDTNLLVVECTVEDVPLVFAKFREIVLNDETLKRLLLITQIERRQYSKDENSMDIDEDTVFDRDPKYCSKYVKTTMWHKLSSMQEMSKTQLMKKTILFQGRSLPLDALLNSKDVKHDQLDDIVDIEAFERLVLSNSIISVGYNTQAIIPDICYISRDFLRDDVIAESNIIEDNCKAIIISDVAGMGKTTTLTKLAAYFKKTLWVLRIDLNNCTKLFAKQMEEERYNLEDPEIVLKFLLGYDSVTPMHRTLFERNLLLYNFKNMGNVVFLLDGFDEICPQYKSITLKILGTLMLSRTEKIIVTTRPHLQKNLEDKLKTRAFKMVPFSKDSQKEFLVKFWSMQIGTRSNMKVVDPTERLKTYANFLVENFSEVIDRNIETFTGIALQLRMVAEIFLENPDGDDLWQGCREFVLSDNDVPKLRDRLDLYSLYTEFVNRKFEIYCSAKKKEDSTNVSVQLDRQVLMRNFYESHELLAMCSIFYTTRHMELLPPEKIGEIFAGKQNVGLVSNINDKYYERTGYMLPQFIHRTFAEYFIARYISNMLLYDIHSDGEYESLWERILMEILFSALHSTLKCFLDGRLCVQLLEDSPKSSTTLKGTFDSLWNDGRLKESDQNQTLFHRIAMEGHLNILRALWGILSDSLKNTIINNRDRHEETMLHVAAKYGQLELVKWLATPRNEGGAGADVEAKDSYAMTPVMTVSNNNYLEVIKWLVKPREDGGGGAHTDLEDIHGQKLIHRHIESGRVDVVKWLLETKENGGGGVSYEVEDAHGLKLIHYIANTQFFKELLSWLIEHYPVNIYEMDGEGNTILHYAAYKGQMDILKWLVTPATEGGVGGDITIKSEGGSTLIHEAASSGNTDLVKWLVGQNKIDVLQKDNNGRTAFHEAARLGCLDIIQVLSETCLVDPNDEDTQGISVLMEAASFGHYELVEFLICNQDEQLTVNVNQSILHLAARHGELKLVQWLVNKVHLTPHIPDNKGRTVLHEACKHANIAVGKWLVEYYTNNHLTDIINAVDVDKRTALHEIIHSNLRTNLYNWLDVRNIFIKSATTYETGLYEIIFPEDMPDAVKNMVVLKMIEWGNEYNENSDCNKIKIETSELITVLLRAGARLDIKDSVGKTALHELTSGNLPFFLPVVQLLLNERIDEKPVDFCSEDNSGKTVLHYAVDAVDTGLTEWLLSPEGGHMDINTIYSDGMNIIRYAFLVESKDTLKLTYHDNILRYFLESIGSGENYPTFIISAFEFDNLDILKWTRHSCLRDIFVEDCEGRSTLYYAAKYDRLSILRWMVAPGSSSGAGINVNTKDRYGNTLLHYACQFNRTAIVKWLLDLPEYKGGVVNLRTQNCAELTPLECGVRFNSLNVVKALLTWTAPSTQHIETANAPLDVEECFRKGRTVLFAAVECAELAVVRWLAAPRCSGGAGADVNASDADGATPLHRAVQLDRVEAARWLATCRRAGGGGADVNAEDADGRTPLLWAALWKRRAILDHLVLSRGRGGGGADLYAADSDGTTFLHCIAEQGDLGLLQELCLKRHEGGAGADLYVRDLRGRLCLHYAGMGGQVRVVEWLVKAKSQGGMEMNVRDKDSLGKTCIQYASEKGYFQAVECINSILDFFGKGDT